MQFLLINIYYLRKIWKYVEETSVEKQDFFKIPALLFFIGIDPCLADPCPKNAICKMKGNSFKCVCKTGWEGPQCEKGKRKTILQNTLDNVEIHHVNILDICVKLTSDLARMGLVNFMLMTCMFP